MNILITGGGSEEPIDTVRSICNFSTGRTASFLAQKFSQKGFKITLLTSKRAVKPEETESLKVQNYLTFKDLESNLKNLCQNQNFDVIIQAAAVSDYSVSSITVDNNEYDINQISKIPSGLNVSINLKNNPKLVDSIKAWSQKANSCPMLVAFKLTSGASIEERKIAVKKVFDSTQNQDLMPDYVVSNDLSQINQDEHPCTIYSKDMSVAAQSKDLDGLFNELLTLIQDYSKKNKTGDCK